MTKTKNTKNRQPLFKFEETNDSTAMRSLTIIFIIMLAIIMAIYVLGVMYTMSILAEIAFVLAIVAFIGFIIIRNGIKKAARGLNTKEIDDAVEQYKMDLIDTYTGYDVAYDRDLIIREADAYRQRLEEENASYIDLNKGSITNIIKAMLDDSREVKAIRKEKKRASKASRNSDR